MQLGEVAVTIVLKFTIEISLIVDKNYQIIVVAVIIMMKIN